MLVRLRLSVLMTCLYVRLSSATVSCSFIFAADMRLASVLRKGNLITIRLWFSEEAERWRQWMWVFCTTWRIGRPQTEKHTHTRDCRPDTLNTHKTNEWSTVLSCQVTSFREQAGLRIIITCWSFFCIEWKEGCVMWQQQNSEEEV